MIMIRRHQPEAAVYIVGKVRVWEPPQLPSHGRQYKVGIEGIKMGRGTVGILRYNLR